MRTRYPVPTRQFLVTILVCAGSITLFSLALSGKLGRASTEVLAVGLLVCLGALAFTVAELFAGRALWYPPAEHCVLTGAATDRYHLAEMRTTRWVGVEVRVNYESSDGGIPPMEIVVEDSDRRVFKTSGLLREQPRKPCVYVTVLPGRTIEALHVYLDVRADAKPGTVIRAELYPVLALARNRIYCYGGLENQSGPIL